MLENDNSSCFRLHKLIPVVPHKAVAEVSKIGKLEKVGCCESGMAARSC